jgi:hypothetical protein
MTTLREAKIASPVRQILGASSTGKAMKDSLFTHRSLFAVVFDLVQRGRRKRRISRKTVRRHRASLNPQRRFR